VAKQSGRPGTDGATKQSTSPESSAQWRVALSASAKLFYRNLHIRCPNEDNEKSRCALLASVDATLAAIAANPCNKKYALGGPLSDLFHMNERGIRICWTTMPEAAVAAVIFMTDRPQKVADINDRARLLADLMQAGYFPVVDEYVKATDPGPNPPLH